MNVKICLDCKKVNPEDSNYCCNCGNNTFMTEKEVEEYIKAAKDGNVVDLSYRNHMLLKSYGKVYGIENIDDVLEDLVKRVLIDYGVLENEVRNEQNGGK